MLATSAQFASISANLEHIRHIFTQLERYMLHIHASLIPTSFLSLLQLLSEHLLILYMFNGIF